MKLFEFGPTKDEPELIKYYRLGCDCGSPDCDLEVEVRIHEILDPTLTFTVVLSTRMYERHTGVGWLDSIINRVMVAFNVLVFGEVKQHKEFCVGRNNVQAFEHLIQYVKNDGSNYLSSG